MKAVCFASFVFILFAFILHVLFSVCFLFSKDKKSRQSWLQEHQNSEGIMYSTSKVCTLNTGQKSTGIFFVRKTTVFSIFSDYYHRFNSTVYINSKPAWK